MANWVQGVDSSYDPLTVNEAKRLKASGQQLFVQALSALPPGGLEQPQSRVISLRNAQHAGLPFAGYALVGSQDGPGSIQFAYSGIPNDLWKELKFVAVDVEVKTTFGVVSAAMKRVQLLGPHLIPVLYTNYNTWVHTLGNPQIPSDWFIWNAYWDENPDVDFARLPFGGASVEQVIGEQWMGGNVLEGQFVDRNSFDADVLFPKAPPASGGSDQPSLRDAREAIETLIHYVG